MPPSTGRSEFPAYIPEFSGSGCFFHDIWLLWFVKTKRTEFSMKEVVSDSSVLHGVVFDQRELLRNEWQKPTTEILASVPLGC